MAKKKRRATGQNEQAGDYRPNTGLTLKEVQPLTANQRHVFDKFDEKHLSLSGCAGTGKTFLALYLALRAVLLGDDYRRVVLVRSVVPTRDMGFLPGNAREKSQPYEAPYIEVCSEIFGRGDAYDILKRRGVLEFTTTSFIRGITLRECVVVVDEIQNMDWGELSSIITRIGVNCKIIFSGDYKQSDFRGKEFGVKDDVLKFLRVIQKMQDDFEMIEFKTADIVRSGLVKRFLIMVENM